MDGHALELDGRELRHGRVAVRRDALPGHAEGHRARWRGWSGPAAGCVMIAYGDPHAIDFIGFFVAAVRTVRPDFDGPAERSAAAPVPVAGSRAAGPGTAGGRARGRDAWRRSPRPPGSAAATTLWEWVIWSNPLPWSAARRARPLRRRARLRPAGAGGTRPQPRRRQRHGAPVQPGQHRHRHQGGNYPALAERGRPLTASPPRHIR